MLGIGRLPGDRTKITRSPGPLNSLSRDRINGSCLRLELIDEAETSKCFESIIDYQYSSDFCMT